MSLLLKKTTVFRGPKSYINSCCFRVFEPSILRVGHDREQWGFFLVDYKFDWYNPLSYYTCICKYAQTNKCFGAAHFCSSSTTSTQDDCILFHTLVQISKASG